MTTYGWTWCHFVELRGIADKPIVLLSWQCAWLLHRSWIAVSNLGGKYWKAYTCNLLVGSTSLAASDKHIHLSCRRVHAQWLTSIPMQAVGWFMLVDRVQIFPLCSDRSMAWRIAELNRVLDSRLCKGKIGLQPIWLLSFRHICVVFQLIVS